MRALSSYSCPCTGAALSQRKGERSRDSRGKATCSVALAGAWLGVRGRGRVRVGVRVRVRVSVRVRVGLIRSRRRLLPPLGRAAEAQEVDHEQRR